MLKISRWLCAVQLWKHGGVSTAQENVYIEMCKGEIIQELLNECGTYLKTSKQLYSKIQNDTKKTK